MLSASLPVDMSNQLQKHYLLLPAPKQEGELFRNESNQAGAGAEGGHQEGRERPETHPSLVAVPPPRWNPGTHPQE